MKKVRTISFIVLILVLLTVINNIVLAVEDNTLTKNEILDLSKETLETTEGNGWKWIEESKTLILNDFNQDVNDSYGIVLPDGDVIIEVNGQNNIRCTSSNKCRGIVLDKGSLTIRGNGTLNIDISGGNVSSVGILILNGGITFDNTNVNINNTSTTKNAAGVYANSFFNINGGNIVINCFDNYVENKEAETRAVFCINDINMQNTNLKCNVTSKKGMGISIQTANGNIKIYDSDITTSQEVFGANGGIWTYNNLEIVNSKLNEKAISTSDNLSSSESISANNGSEQRIESSYGIWAENNITISTSTIQINTKANDASSFGIGSSNELVINNSDINIETNNETGEYDYGIGKSKKITINGGKFAINAKEIAIFAIENIEIENTYIKQGGIIRSTSDNTRTTIAEEDSIITATDNLLTGGSKSVLIEEQIETQHIFNYWIIIIIFIILIIIILAALIIKKVKNSRNKK